jgi:hypothetical protein
MHKCDASELLQLAHRLQLPLAAWLCACVHECSISFEVGVNEFYPLFRILPTASRLQGPCGYGDVGSMMLTAGLAHHTNTALMLQADPTST